MAVSEALERSARDFCLKYACNFSFTGFEASVEEFTFLRPIGGWTDAYKAAFERLYMQALEPVAGHAGKTLDGEAMLDDFEYTLIRPYVNESEGEIKHKPYLGMDRVSRIEYLQQLTSRSPSNYVDLYAKKYRSGQLSMRQMRSSLEDGIGDMESRVELVGCVEALDTVHKERSLIWRAFHPFKNQAEKRASLQMKREYIEKTHSTDEDYGEIASAALKTFDGSIEVTGEAYLDTWGEFLSDKGDIFIELDDDCLFPTIDYSDYRANRRIHITEGITYPKEMTSLLPQDGSKVRVRAVINGISAEYLHNSRRSGGVGTWAELVSLELLP